MLDPTPSARLAELKEAFESSGGSVFIGKEAWNHLEEKAGLIMSKFIDRYIKPPLETINAFDTSSLRELTLTWRPEQLIIAGGGDEYVVSRVQTDPSLAKEVIGGESES